MEWSDVDFLKHFYFGKGKPVTLTDAGLLEKVKSQADTVAIGKFKDQIRANGKSSNSLKLSVAFENSYGFKSVVYSLGGATLKGTFSGGVCPWLGSSPPQFWIEGKITITFSDEFTDPLSIIEMLYGSSTSPAVPSWLRDALNLGGVGYPIRDSWHLSFREEHVS